MTWNYRIVRHLEKRVTGPAETYFALHEAYYDKPSDEKPKLITTEPVALHGENEADLRLNLEQQQQAFTKPVLNFEDF